MAEYIEREALIAEIEENINTYWNEGSGGYYLAEDALDYSIKTAPTADVEEVRHGQWLPQIVSGVKAWDCSECKTLGSPHWKRCPICEAKMDGGKAE